MKKLINMIYWFIYKLKLINKEFRLGINVKVKDSQIEGKGYVGKNSNIEGVFIGRGSYIGRDSDLKNSRIGSYSSIGHNVEVVRGNHPTRGYVSTSPVFYGEFKKHGYNFKKYLDYNNKKEIEKKSVIIGNDVWIGNNVKIMSGLRIGDGAIIGTGAVVVKDVESYSIVGGVPAREIRKRFEDEEIEFLKEFKWWSKEINWLEENIDLFSDINKLKNEYKFKDE